MTDRDWTRPAIVEFIGTFALIFMGVGAIIQTQGKDLVAIAFAHGLAIGLMVTALGHISGGLFNPALTVGFLVARRISPSRFVVYIVAQLLGGIAGAACLTLVYRSGERNAAGVNLGVPAVGAGHSSGNALIMEVILTFFLMFVVFGAAVDKRTGGRAVAGFAIGLTITMDIFAGGSVSSAIMNPARAFGPAIVRWQWSDHWIWWVGPIVGAIIAALLYNDGILGNFLPSWVGGQDVEVDAQATDATATAQSETRRG